MDNSSIQNGTAPVSDNALFDLAVIQRMAFRYSLIADIYMYACDSNGDILCDVTGTKEENQRIVRLIGEEQLDDIFHRVTDDEMEVQAEEDTSIPNIKVAAVSLHVDHKPVITWVIMAVLKDEDIISTPGSIVPTEFSRNTTKEK